MKIKQLIQKLQKLDPNAEVILPSDAEGNSFNRLYQMGECLYVKSIEKTEFGILEREIELGDSVEDFEDLEGYTKPKKCVVLWPN